MNELKTSQQILDMFFKKMSEKEGLHQPTVDALIGLHGDNKFTKTHITNALEAARMESEDK